MRLAIIDDDQELAELLIAHVRNFLLRRGLRESEIHSFSSSGAFLCSWQSGYYDIIFLDIFIDELNGVDIAHRIRQTDENVVLVFCTSSNEFASQSYEVNARYYLHKPISESKIEQMFNRIDLARIRSARSIQLPDGYRVLLRRLIYTNYANHVVTFHFNGLPPHSTYISQSEVEKLLNQSGFYAANKGNLVNLNMVKRLTEQGFVMKDNTVISVARRRYKEAQEAYRRFHFEQLCKEADAE